MYRSFHTGTFYIFLTVPRPHRTVPAAGLLLLQATYRSTCGRSTDGKKKNELRVACYTTSVSWDRGGGARKNGALVGRLCCCIAGAAAKNLSALIRSTSYNTAAALIVFVNYGERDITSLQQ